MAGEKPCSASASSYASAPGSFSRRVEPSMSVKSKVTVPVELVGHEP